MTFTLLLTLLLIAGGCALLKWYRASGFFCCAAGLFFWSVGSGLPARWVLTDLQAAYAHDTPPEWGKRNAIVMLGAGTVQIPNTRQVEAGTLAYARILKTFALYRACQHSGQRCTVIVSGGDAQHHGRPEAEVYGEILRSLGVAASELMLETKSMNTYQNAQFSRALLEQLHPDRIVLVTSGFHIRRSLLYFAHFGIGATGIRADLLASFRSLFPIAYNFTVTDLALKEYLGVARYHLYNALGWNIRAVRPGSL